MIKTYLSFPRVHMGRLKYYSCSNMSLIIGYVIEGITSKITMNHLTFRLYTPHTDKLANLCGREILPNSQYYHYYVIWLSRRSREHGKYECAWVQYGIPCGAIKIIIQV